MLIQFSGILHHCYISVFLGVFYIVVEILWSDPPFIEFVDIRRNIGTSPVGKKLAEEKLRTVSGRRDIDYSLLFVLRNVCW